MPDYDICPRKKEMNLNNQNTIGSKWDENSLLEKLLAKKKVERIRTQQIRKSCGIQQVNEWIERSRRKWDEHVTGMDVESLVKISRLNIPAGKSPGRPERLCSDLILG